MDIIITGAIWLILGTLFAIGYNLGSTIYELSGFYLDKATVGWDRF